MLWVLNTAECSSRAWSLEWIFQAVCTWWVQMMSKQPSDACFFDLAVRKKGHSTFLNPSYLAEPVMTPAVLIFPLKYSLQCSVSSTLMSASNTSEGCGSLYKSSPIVYLTHVIFAAPSTSICIWFFCLPLSIDENVWCCLSLLPNEISKYAILFGCLVGEIIFRFHSKFISNV